MSLGGELEKFFLDAVGIEPGAPRCIEQSVVISHAKRSHKKTKTSGSSARRGLRLLPSDASSAEAFAAGATGGRIRVLHFEAAVLEGVAIIQLAAGDVEIGRAHA